MQINKLWHTDIGLRLSFESKCANTDLAFWKDTNQILLGETEFWLSTNWRADSAITSSSSIPFLSDLVLNVSLTTG